MQKPETGLGLSQNAAKPTWKDSFIRSVGGAGHAFVSSPKEYSFHFSATGNLDRASASHHRLRRVAPPRDRENEEKVGDRPRPATERVSTVVGRIRVLLLREHPVQLFVERLESLLVSFGGSQ